jgi:hypothetical protein
MWTLTQVSSPRSSEATSPISTSRRTSWRTSSAPSAKHSEVWGTPRHPLRFARLLYRSGDPFNGNLWCAWSAAFVVWRSAATFGRGMGLRPESIAPAGTCRIVTRWSRRPTRNGDRRWRSRSVSVGDEERQSPRKQGSIRPLIPHHVDRASAPTGPTQASARRSLSALTPLTLCQAGYQQPWRARALLLTPMWGLLQVKEVENAAHCDPPPVPTRFSTPLW